MRNKQKKYLSAAIIFFLIVAVMSGVSYAFQPEVNRLLDARQHRNGKLWMWITNFGQFGTDQDHGTYWPGRLREDNPSGYYNRGGLMLGGIVPADGHGFNPVGGMDTLVSEGPSIWSVCDFRELFPHYADDRSKIEVRSTLPGTPYYHLDAVSEEDFIAVYTDTFVARLGASWQTAKHRRSLGLEVIESSYQWSYSYAEDIIFFDLKVINIGELDIKQFYLGFFADNDVWGRGADFSSQRDDIGGFMERNSVGDIVNTAWCGDDDSDEGIIPGVIGVRILRPTTGRISYNWWMSDSDVGSSSDWGPRTKDVVSGKVDPNDPYGSPEWDREKYVLLVNGSFDPPQYNPDTKEWYPDIPAGADPNDNSRFMISFGPLGTPTGGSFSTPRGTEAETIFSPGDTVEFTYAVFGGEGDPAVAASLESTDPAAFVDCGLNAAMALSMYDNPGVDTDGDGYAGDDTDGDGVIDTGDGVPDFTGPPPPPSPPLTVAVSDRKVSLDWSVADPGSAGYDPNDQALPLNFIDPFISDDPNTSEDESKDFEGFLVMRSKTGLISDYEIIAVYDKAGNEYGRNTGLRYEFEDYIANGETYYYSVCSFDRGVPEVGLESLRSSPLINAKKITASDELNTGLTKQIWVEPNPYIERSGFEPTTTSSLQIEHNRVLDFCNLPAKCTVRIYTLDGDLVQTLDKDDPNSSRLRWDMLTRSIQSITSGIYVYSVVDDSNNKYVGKFVVIK